MPLARDVYSFLHLPLILGIIFTALGLKTVIADVAAPEMTYMTATEARTLYGGVALFLFTEVVIVLRTFRRLRYPGLVTGLALLGLGLLAHRVPALVALGLLLAVCLGLVVAQRLLHADVRAEVRGSALREQMALEDDTSRWRRENL